MMTPEQLKTLFSLLSTPAPTGFETQGQKLWMQEAKKSGATMGQDAYGTAWAVLEGKGKKPRVMLEAHADEIGFMVKHITDDGFLRVTPLGGSDAAIARARKVTIFGDDGEVNGVIGNTAIHIRRADSNGKEEIPKMHELFVDIGAPDAAAVMKLGIRVGNPVVYRDTPERIGANQLTGRAIDNRVGGFVVLQALHKLAAEKAKFPGTLLAVNAVQEEVGARGAQMVAHRLEPDCAIVIDMTHATDTPGIDHGRHGKVKLGGGPTVTHGNGNHPALVSHLMEIAKRKKIPLQHEAVSQTSGTDMDRIYQVREGVPCALVSIPVRYMHSPTEMIDLRDIERTVELLAAYVKEVSEEHLP